jgi:hypothetical protein
VADLQSRADGAQDKHGLRSEPRPCELCGQLVVSVCDSLDMGEAVTCHYEPATEDETAKRIAALEAELATLYSRLDFTSCQKEDVEAQVLEIEEQNSALRQDAEVGRALENVPDLFQLWQEDDLWYVEYLDYGSHKMVEFFGDTLYAALEAAGLMEK